MANFADARDAARDFAVSGAVALNVFGPAAPMGLAQADLAPLEQQATVQLVDDTREAVNALVEGKSAGDDAASAEPVPEPEASDTSDPPDGWTSAWLDWSPSDTDSIDVDATEQVDAADVADAGDAADSEGFGDA